MRSVILGLLIAALFPACIVKRLSGPRLTGTCAGACDHYVACKPSHLEADRQRCRAECPDVFSDSESLMMYESMSCHDAVEYVDGSGAHDATADHRAQ